MKFLITTIPPKNSFVNQKIGDCAPIGIVVKYKIRHCLLYLVIRFIGMGESQRYQAAVDGQKSRCESLEKSEKIHGNRATGVGRQRMTATRETLGDGLAVVLLPGKLRPAGRFLRI